MSSSIDRSAFGRLPDGRAVDAFVLTSSAGVTARILTLGGILQSVTAPDRDGRSGDIVLGFDEVGGYLADRAYMGALIGRVAGRLAGGRLRIDGQTYQLSRNDGENTLHGGAVGFDRALWEVEAAGVEGGRAVLRLIHESPDGDQGFPGRVVTRAIYALDGAGRLSLELEATCDAPTLVNLTSHPYWNLAGAPNPVGDHWLRIAADRAFVMGEYLVPAKTPSPVAGSALDLRQPRRLADVIAADDPAIRAVGGLDHLFVLDGEAPAAKLGHPATGRTLTIETDAAAFVAYGAGGLGEGPPGKGGVRHASGTAVALEPQARPDAPRILRPGEVFRWRQVLSFGTDA